MPRGMPSCICANRQQPKLMQRQGQPHSECCGRANNVGKTMGTIWAMTQHPAPTIMGHRERQAPGLDCPRGLARNHELQSHGQSRMYYALIIRGRPTVPSGRVVLELSNNILQTLIRISLMKNTHSYGQSWGHWPNIEPHSR